MPQGIRQKNLAYKDARPPPLSFITKVILVNLRRV